jgi:cell division protein FtsA
MTKKIYTGLDVGSTKVAAVIGERDDAGGLRFVGAGTSLSEGLRRGAVVNLEKTVGSIARAVEEAERTAGVNVKAVVAGIAGDHIRSINSRGVVAVSNRQNEINQEDVARVVEATKAFAIPPDREIIHAIPQQYIVDDQDEIRDPIGMPGVRLEAEVHLITAATTTARNLAQSVHKAGVRLEDLVLEPLASANAVLGDDEKDLGAMLLDIGGGTTGLAVFADGVLQHTAVIGFGGAHITSDIAMCLHTPLDKAERLKIEHGYALAGRVRSEGMVTVPGIGGREPREVSRFELARLIEARVEEIFTLVLKEIRRVHTGDLLGAGIVLTGGTSELAGIVELAEQIFEAPIRRGGPRGFAGLTGPLTSPRYATAVGLALHAYETEGMNGNGHRSVFGRLRRKVGEFVGGFHV